MSSQEEENEKIYAVAVEVLRYEGGLLWQIFNTFLVIHSVFLAFLFQSVAAADQPPSRSWTVAAASLGLVICVPWWASYARNVGHYRYHLARVRALEPQGWNLYGGFGGDFSAGKPVQVGSETHGLGWLAQRVRSGRMIPPVILLYVLAYLAVGFAGLYEPPSTPPAAS